MMKNITGSLLITFISLGAIAGGNTEFVKFPEGYKDSFTHYGTQNRANNKQVADMYANSIAINSVKDGNLADGSVIIMEIYKPEVDDTENPVAGPDGIFKKAGLAAIAVMEKRSDWDAAYPAEERAGNWGFALYDTAGMPKENDLDCASCHTPLTKSDFMFTFSKLPGQ